MGVYEDNLRRSQEDSRHSALIEALWVQWLSIYRKAGGCPGPIYLYQDGNRLVLDQEWDHRVNQAKVVSTNFRSFNLTADKFRSHLRQVFQSIRTEGLEA